MQRVWGLEASVSIHHVLRPGGLIPDRDIWAAANEVIKGNSDPLVFATQRYDALLEAGDMEGCRVWRRIETAIAELLNDKPEGATH